MHTDTAGIAVTELHGEDKQHVVATAMAGDLELTAIAETEAQRLYRVLATPAILSKANRAERQCAEAKRIAADIAFAAYKASGQLRRDADRRALEAQVQFGDAQ